MLTSILGIVVVLVEISMKDNFERKKYMGVHRFESELTASMIRRFPMTVTRYVDKNKLKMTGCRSGSSVSPRRRNFEVSDWFMGSMLLVNLTQKIW
jgi:hypothetical protein